MAKYRDTVETLLTARNEVAGELRQAEQQMRQQAARQKQQAQEQERIAKERERDSIEQIANLTRLAAAVGAAELGISALNVGTQLLSGDMDAAADAAERIPLGIGSAVSQGREFWETISGAREEAERLERINERQAEAEKMRVANAQEAREAVRDHRSEMLAIERELALLRAEPDEREDLRFRFENLQDIEAIEQKIAEQRDAAREIEREQQEEREANLERLQRLEVQISRGEFGITGTGEQIKAERDAVREVLREMREEREAPERRIEQLQEQRERLRETIGERRRDRDRQEERERNETARETERKRVEAAREAAHDVRQLWLRQTGQTERAEIEAIRRTTAERVRAAEEARNAELAAHERMLGRMREMEVRERDRRRREAEAADAQRAELMEREQEIEARLNRGSGRGGPADLPSLDQDRFLTGVRQTTQQQDRAVAERERQQLDVLKQNLAELRAARRAIEENTREMQGAPLVRVASLRGGP